MENPWGDSVEFYQIPQKALFKEENCCLNSTFTVNLQTRLWELIHLEEFNYWRNVKILRWKECCRCCQHLISIQTNLFPEITSDVFFLYQGNQTAEVTLPTPLPLVCLVPVYYHLHTPAELYINTRSHVLKLYNQFIPFSVSCIFNCH